MVRQQITGQAAVPGKSNPAAWITGKTAPELDVLEFEGRSLFQDSIRKKNHETNELLELPVMLRCPSSTDLMKARIKALDWVKELASLKSRPTIPEAEALLGADYFDTLDTICVMSHCVREAREPYAQLTDHKGLDANYSKASLFDLWDRINHYNSKEDPRMSSVNEEEFWAVVALIDERRDLGPLLVIDGAARDSFIVSMASRLQNSQTPKSLSQSTETSTPAP